MKFKKNDTILATNVDTNEQVQFRCPHQMCDKMLKRYMIMYLGENDGNWVFTVQ